MMLTQSVLYTLLASVLLGSIYFVDRTDGQVFTLPIFSMISAFVEKLASGAYRGANKTCHMKTCHRKLVRP